MEAVTIVASRGVADGEFANVNILREAGFASTVPDEEVLAGAGVQLEVYRELPPDVQAEVLNAARLRSMRSRLAAPAAPAALSPARATNGSDEGLPSDDQECLGIIGDVRMANVVAGAPMPARTGLYLLIDRFAFNSCSAPAVIRK